MPGPLNDQWVFFPFAGITFGASAVNWLHWNDQKDCNQFYTQLYWQFVTPVSCGQKKKEWISPGEKQKIGKREAAWGFLPSLLERLGKIRAHSLLNGRVSFGVMSAKRNRLNKRFWQAGCPGFLTKILNDIDKCWCYRILHKEILELFSSSAAGLVSVDCTVWHRASWVCVLSWIVGEFTAWQPLVQVCPDLCGDVVLFTVQWWTRAAESHRELPSCRSAPESCHMLITVSLPSSKLWTGSWQKLLLYIQIGFRCSKEVDLATYKKKKKAMQLFSMEKYS